VSILIFGELYISAASQFIMVCDAMEGFEVLLEDYFSIFVPFFFFMLDIVSNSHSSLAFGIQCSIPFFLAIEVNKAEKKHLG
jgi:hypothetical protein